MSVSERERAKSLVGVVGRSDDGGDQELHIWLQPERMIYKQSRRLDCRGHVT